MLYANWFEWWVGLSPWVRYGVSLFFLAISTVIWLCGYFWPWGWAVGGALLFASFLIDEFARDPSPLPHRDGERQYRPPSRVERAATRLIKPFIILAFLGGLGWAGWAIVDWRRDYDPDAKLNAVLARLETGMSVQEVVAICGEPKEAYRFTEEGYTFHERGDAQPIGVGSVAPVTYTPDFVKVHGEALRFGFLFIYSFGYHSAGNVRELHFDPSGTLVDIVKPGGLAQELRERRRRAWQAGRDP